ncbi:MAG: hypothetical protein M3Y09_06700 [Actinomycetota bacterium]|nr:hypothetical protein [Actinomycetota bacterium]
MTAPDPSEAMREVVREVMRELTHGVLGDSPAPQRANGGADHPGAHNRNGAGARPDASATNDRRDDAAIVAQVPAPPVAAVFRPSTWRSPASPGEVIGDRAAVAAQVIGDHGSPGRVEAVTIDTNEDLERFVRGLVSRVSNPRDLAAIQTGRLRFALRRSTSSAGADANVPGQPQVATVRVVKGAITERAVRDAAAEGARLVLARGAVLTPLARDRARALGVEIERERKC